MSSTYWTDEQVHFLKANAYRLKAKEIGAAIGRTEGAVHRKALAMGISMLKVGKYNWNCTISDEDIELCRQLYDEGVPQNEIAEKMEISIQHVCNVVNYRARTTQTTP